MLLCVFGFLHCQGYLFHDFHLLNNPLPLRNARGFSFPRNIPTKNFSENFFKTTPSDFLLIFWREKLWRGAASCQLPQGGGVPFFVGLLGFSLPLFLSFLACSGSAPRPSILVGFPASVLIVRHWEHRGGSGLWKHSEQVQKGSK